jgi:hypothetical protein
MAKAIGVDQNLIAALSHAVFAIAIELGSGVGFWLVFGHGSPLPRREELEAPAPPMALTPIDRAGAQDLQVIGERAEDIIERFFREGVRPKRGGRVQSEVVWKAYKQWCIDRDLPYVSHTKFGRLARWPKERSGNVWYINCELVEERAKLAPATQPKALPPRLGSMAKPVMAERG